MGRLQSNVEIKAPTRIYSFDRKVYDREVRRGMGLGVGLGQGGPLQGMRGLNGNFASLFTGVLQSVQTDLGLTLGGTMLDTGGTGPVITLSGSLSGPPVPIWVKCTLGGARGTWTYAVYYDGLGVTPAMTGTSLGIVPLTGAGTGLVLLIAAGTATVNNVWKATCSALADQSGNGVNCTQATAASQPILTTGLNGFAGIAFDGVDDYLSYSLSLPAPATTPTFFWYVLRRLNSPGSFGAICVDSSGASGLFYYASGSTVYMQNNLNVNAVPYALNTWGRGYALFTGSIADAHKFGATLATSGNAGNTAGSGVRTLSSTGSPIQYELLALVTLNNKPGSTVLAAADAAVTSKYGSLVAV